MTTVVRRACGWLTITSLLVLFFSACDSGRQGGGGSQASLPEGYRAPATTDHLPLVDHPEYVNWIRFPVGTYVVRKKEVTNDFSQVRVTTRLSLREKTAEKVVVESQVTVDRPGEALAENPPLEMPFAAQFRLPEGMMIEQFLLPSFKAKQVGEETREVGGREFKTQVFAWEERNETGPMAVKLWRSDDVPGRMLRQEIEGHQHHSVEEVVEIVVPEEK